MAAAVRPSPADARVPCPLCGGPIHPIAGRCKHCKGDLRAMRQARPAAAAKLPSLIARAATAEPTYTRGNQNGHAAHAHGQLRNGHAAYAPPAAPPPSPPPSPPQAAPMPPAVVDGSQPVLPPRPTGRMYAAPPAPAWWKSWPLVVIVLAGLAIIAAVILMVWPHDDETPLEAYRPAGATKPAPAPERMDTDPLPPTQPGPQPAPDPAPPAAPDPWNGGAVAPQPAPPPPPPPAAPDIDIPDDPDADDTTATDPDPGAVGGGVVGGIGSSGPALRGAGAIMMGMMRHACDRAATCGNLDDMMQDYCKMTRSLQIAPPPASCSAAQRCFERIDEMDCTTDWNDVGALNSVIYKFQACVEAMAC